MLMKKIVSFAILITAIVFLFILYNYFSKTTLVFQGRNMKIVSSMFQNNTKILSKYTCDGENINPPLNFLDVPANAKSLVLIMDDPDAPMRIFVHWVLYNIDPLEKGILENSVSPSALQGKTSRGVVGYVGACPPSGTHRYFFKLYALDSTLELKNPDKTELEEKMQGHIIDKAELIGLYSRK